MKSSTSLFPHSFKSLVVHAIILALLISVGRTQTKKIQEQEQKITAELEAQRKAEEELNLKEQEELAEEELLDKLKERLEEIVEDELEPEDEDQLVEKIDEIVEENFEQALEEKQVSELTQDEIGKVEEEVLKKSLDELDLDLTEMRKEAILAEVRMAEPQDHFLRCLARRRLDGRADLAVVRVGDDSWPRRRANTWSAGTDRRLVAAGTPTSSEEFARRQRPRGLARFLATNGPRTPTRTMMAGKCA